MQVLQVLLITWLKMLAICNFYILPNARENGRFLFCCSLLEKLNESGHSVYVYCQNKEEASVFDDLLWTFKETSFIPHSLVGEYSMTESPIQIGFQPPPVAFHDVLILLAVLPDVPNFCQSFNRIVEIVNQEPEVKEKLRTHYQYYRALGWQINTHSL